MNNDLISRSELLKKAVNMIDYDEGGWEKILAIKIWDVKEAPAVNAEHVRHGHWEPMVVSSGRDSWKCSECGRRARGKLKNLPYCHCGAKMD